MSDADFFFPHMLSMRPSPPISCFNALLGALAKRKQYSLAISFYKTLCISGILGLRSDLFTLNILVNCYSEMKLGRAAFSAFGLVVKNGHCPDMFTFNSLVKGLCLEEKVVEAARLLPKMIRVGCAPDVVTYSTIIDGLCKTGNVVAALQLYRKLVHCKEGTSGKECCKPKTLSLTLIDGCCVEWPITDLKEKGVRIPLDVVSYSCLIDGLCRLGMDEEARSVFLEMVGNGIHPNSVTFSILINFLCKKGKMEQGMELLDMMISRGVLPDIVTYSTILSGYFRIGKIEEAISLYSNMKKMHSKSGLVSAQGPDHFTYSTMIDGLCKHGYLGNAEVLFSEMQGSGVSPNIYVYNA